MLKLSLCRWVNPLSFANCKQVCRYLLCPLHSAEHRDTLEWQCDEEKTKSMLWLSESTLVTDAVLAAEWPDGGWCSGHMKVASGGPPILTPSPLNWSSGCTKGPVAPFLPPQKSPHLPLHSLPPTFTLHPCYQRRLKQLCYWREVWLW